MVGRPPASTGSRPAQGSAIHVEWLEERAAILEFDAGVPRAEAERIVRSMACPFESPAQRPGQ